MYLNKWSYEDHAYHEVEVPDGSYPICLPNMHEIVNCPHCYNRFPVGIGYTSLEFHQLLTGYGYTVCPKCHEEEMNRRMAHDGL